MRFCGGFVDGEPRHVTDFIPSQGAVAADQFVRWVFLAEDMAFHFDDPKWQGLKDEIRSAFAQHMGAEVVDAKKLRWSDLPKAD